MKKRILSGFFCLLFIFTLNSIEVKILWWNVKNFFDTVDDLKTDDTVMTTDQYEKKLGQISTIIKKINPDIAGFAEIENIEILKDLSVKTGLPFYYLVPGNDPRGIDVALLSKYQAEYISHKDMPTPYKGNNNYKFSRDCPEAKITIKNKTIYILLNHHKAESYNDENTEKKRNAQSKGILDIISDIYKKNTEEPYIFLMGDFNSKRYSEPLNILSKSGLEIINYQYKQAPTFVYSKNREKSELDYMIFNKKLFKEAKIKKFKIINDISKDISDHYPVYIEIDF